MNLRPIVLILLSVLFNPVPKASALVASGGKWDYAYAFGLRSQPVGLRLWGELGYNHLLWGSNPGSGNPFYGYLRPKISAQSSGLVNRADVGIDLAFWAPLVIEIVHAWNHRAKDFSEFDCVALQCRGLLTRTKVAGKMTAAYGDYFVLWDSLVEQVRGPKEPAIDFADHSWSLAGEYPKDFLFSTELTLGKKITKQWTAGLIGEKSMFKKSQEESTSALAFVSIQYASGMRYFVGAGYYESSRIKPGFTSAFGLSWVGAESFSIR